MIKTNFILATLSLGFFCIATISLSVVGMGPAITAHFNTSPGAAGWLMTSFAMTFAVAAPIGQFVLSPKLGSRQMLVYGLALMSGALFAGSIAPGFEVLLITRVVAAAGCAMLAPTAAALTISLVPSEHRARALAVLFFGFTLAGVLGIPLATWLSNLFGWRMTFVFVGTLPLIAVVALLTYLDETAPDHGSTLPSIKTILHRRPLAALVTNSGFLMGQFAIYALFAQFALESMGLSKGALPLMFLLIGVASIIGNIISGILADRLGRDRVIAVALSLCLVGYVLLLFPMAPWLGVGVFCAVALSSTMFPPPQLARLSGYVPQESHALILSLQTSSVYIGIGAGSALSTFLYDLYGSSSLPYASIVIFSLTILCNRLTRPSATHSTQSAAQKAGTGF